jgi:endo-1,3-1,4-beta-glycanase ExoK
MYFHILPVDIIIESIDMHPQKSGPKQAKAIAAFMVTMFGITLSQVQPSRANEQFSDDFKGLGEWKVSNGYSNGNPFGCTWAANEVSASNGLLKLNLKGSFKSNGILDTELSKCGEVQSNRTFQYGSFTANMKPHNTPGSISSFFLYTGKSKTENHFEIDIEFIGGTNILHTDYWINGKKDSSSDDEKNIDLKLKLFGINNVYSKFRRYGFEWHPNKIVWFTYDDAGNRVKLREVKATITARMPIFMNTWNGNNGSDAKLFPGPYSSGNGTAQYEHVWVN